MRLTDLYPPDATLENCEARLKLLIEQHEEALAILKDIIKECGLAYDSEEAFEVFDKMRLREIDMKYALHAFDDAWQDEIARLRRIGG